MASISTDRNGRHIVQFLAHDGRRRTVSLGKVPMRTAQKVCEHVEYLNVARKNGHAPPAQTVTWEASKCGDKLHARLAAVGLVAPRAAAVRTRLKAFIDSYIAGRTDARPQTVLNLRMFGDRLIAFFGPDRDIASIKRSDANAWLIHLKSNYAPATVGRTIKGARQLFRAACDAELLTRDPFAKVKAGSQPDKDRQHFITQDATRRVLEACPDAEWRLIVALSRYGGLRCPSEHLALTWDDVNWERERFRVNSPKTGERWVPIFPELRPFLAEAFDLAEPGAIHVITSKRDQRRTCARGLRRLFAALG